jgi:hypothetical protein
VRIARAFAMVAVATLISACGGGASSSGMAPQAPTSAPVTTQAKTASVSFRIVIPAATTSAVSSAATPTVVACTTTCSATVNAPVGSDTFAVNLYGGTNGTGSLLSTGTLTQTIVANQANSVSVTFNGVVASIALALASPTVTPGTAGSLGITVNALDANGNVIVGPGSYVDANGNAVAITLSNSDTSGSSTLSQASIGAPTTGVALNYTSAFDTNPTITAAATGFTSASATLRFPAPTISSLSVTTGIAGTPVNETFTGTNFVAGTGGTTVAAGTGVTPGTATVTSSTTLTVTLTISGGAAFGVRDVSLTTPAGASGTQPFAVATGAIVVTSNGDTAAGTPPGTGAGGAGDLRAAILAADASPGDVITIACGSPCTITLNGPLPPISANTVIDGGTYGNVIVNGANTYRAFWAQSGTIVLANLKIENAFAHGGNGGAAEASGGGGGAGLGAGLFIDTASVAVINDFFLDTAVVSGNGGDGTTIAGDAGSGGGQWVVQVAEASRPSAAAPARPMTLAVVELRPGQLSS